MKKLKQFAFAVCILVGYAPTSLGQNVGINSDGSIPDNSAMLDVKSTGKGFLVPRMTQAQRNSISSPATGLLIFQTDGTAGFCYNSGTAGSPNWIMLSSSTFTETDPKVGSISTNSLPKWNGTQLVTSNVSDNGTSVAVNTAATAPDNSAMLDVGSTSKGLLIPRMTLAQRNAISSPATGLLVFQTDGTAGFYYNSGTSESPSWILIGSIGYTETDPKVGSNTTNYLSKWNGSALVASNVSEDETTVGVGSRNLTVGSTSQFQVGNTGNITKINNVTTSFPSSQGATNSVLQNDGTGSLSWNASPVIGNSYITPDGGLAVKLTAGEALVRGNVVRGAGDGKVYKTSTTTPENVFGVVYQDASANSDVYVVTTGSAYVLFEAATTNGVWAGVSTTNSGKAYISTTTPAGNTEHDREVGHPIEVIGAAGLAKCIIHFR